MKATKKDLQKLGRLKKRSDFLFVRDKGQKWVSSTVILQASNFDTEHILCGFTATKKLGNAIVRNRIKRRLRSAAAEILSAYAKPGMAYVLIGRAETRHATADKIRDDLKWCLKRMNCLKEDNENDRKSNN